ncbi:hypothetical protein HaLaN_17226 [Haematococcus lacustris]|uniref:Uncharacterized protein n=1 Tax=Haematococcus lacustris TaxID=44745 RepID=A0A699ZNS9_HAELA|nr:hypothetical protein HaLaN_17226 [Haematococcus lacustris]
MPPHWLVTLLAPGWAQQAVFHLPLSQLPACRPGCLLIVQMLLTGRAVGYGLTEYGSAYVLTVIRGHTRMVPPNQSATARRTTHLVMAKKKRKGSDKKQKASRSPQGKQRQERRDGWTTRRRQVTPYVDPAQRPRTVCVDPAFFLPCQNGNFAWLRDKGADLPAQRKLTELGPCCTSFASRWRQQRRGLLRLHRTLSLLPPAAGLHRPPHSPQPYQHCMQLLWRCVRLRLVPGLPGYSHIMQPHRNVQLMQAFAAEGYGLEMALPACINCKLMTAQEGGHTTVPQRAAAAAGPRGLVSQPLVAQARVLLAFGGQSCLLWPVAQLQRAPPALHNALPYPATCMAVVLAWLQQLCPWPCPW